jgi:diguanylate cyclase (GGDEF)-like protein
VDDDFLQLLDDEGTGASQHGKNRPGPWQVLIVDDDQGVHDATVLALQGPLVLGRPLKFLHAFSAAQALEVLRREHDVAVVFLDVVMETADAGLGIVGTIREELGLQRLRIVLRTGQPGYAPDLEVITRYDINDYRVKSELTRSRLFTTLVASLRAYDQLCRLDATRDGLEKIVKASAQFIAEDGLRSFSEGVITQIAGLIGLSPEGLVCCELNRDEHQPGAHERFRVVAAAGRYTQFIDQDISVIGEPHIIKLLTRCLHERRNLIEEDGVALYFPVHENNALAAFIDTDGPVSQVDHYLLDVFCTNIGLCAANVTLVSELRTQAFYDRLVGLPNRAAMVQALDQRLASADKPHCALALLDVDAFAETNDLLGHQYGDQLLIAIARRLGEALPDCFVARIAGDVFGVLGPSALLTDDSLYGVFHTPLQVGGFERPVTFSIGLVDLRDMAGSAQDGIKDAHIALKRAKSAGQGQFAHYSRTIATETRERTRLLQDLRMAFGQGLLYPHYQPQFELASGRVVGFEALLRWRTDDGQFVPPDRFIPVAEQSGLIVAMGAQVLHTARAALKTVHQAGFPGLRMAVNVSVMQLRQPNFVAVVQAALQAGGIAPEALELEVTESVAALGMELMIERLQALRSTGIAIAIDDFGTGFSSLSYLDQLPADRVKIDRAFVHALDSGSGRRIADMIVPLGHKIGLKVLAEGVETEAQAAILKELGCDEVQGYLYGRPMPLDQLLVWLRGQPGA